jgi:hypothetical protein
LLIGFEIRASEPLAAPTDLTVFIDEIKVR